MGMVTLFEVTLANWVRVCRLLMQNVSPYWSIFFITYKCFMGFAVMKVISGVFMHETFQAAATDDDIMVIQRKRLMDLHRNKMQKLFTSADLDGDAGRLSFDELGAAVARPEVRTWLLAQELDIRDVELLFHLIDEDNSGSLTVEELTKGLAYMKGSARSIEMHRALYELHHLSQDVRKLMSHFDV